MATTHVYVLELEGGHFYVGKTMDLKRRLAEHTSGFSGSAWTALHRPSGADFLETRPMTSDFDEDMVTKEFMRRHGIDKVRGGIYAQPELPDFLRRALQLELWGSEDLCLRCGRADHFVRDCFETTRATGEPISPAEEADGALPPASPARAAGAAEGATAPAAPPLSPPRSRGPPASASALASPSPSSSSSSAAAAAAAVVAVSSPSTSLDGITAAVVRMAVDDSSPAPPLPPPSSPPPPPAISFGTVQAASPPSMMCTRCGRTSHFVFSCYATWHEDGSLLQDKGPATTARSGSSPFSSPPSAAPSPAPASAAAAVAAPPSPAAATAAGAVIPKSESPRRPALASEAHPSSPAEARRAEQDVAMMTTTMMPSRRENSAAPSSSPPAASPVSPAARTTALSPPLSPHATTPASPPHPPTSPFPPSPSSPRDPADSAPASSLYGVGALTVERLRDWFGLDDSVGSLRLLFNELAVWGRLRRSLAADLLCAALAHEVRRLRHPGPHSIERYDAVEAAVEALRPRAGAADGPLPPAVMEQAVRDLSPGAAALLLLRRRFRLKAEFAESALEAMAGRQVCAGGWLQRAAEEMDRAVEGLGARLTGLVGGA
jgi:hypothetical protein